MTIKKIYLCNFCVVYLVKFTFSCYNLNYDDAVVRDTFASQTVLGYRLKLYQTTIAF